MRVDIDWLLLDRLFQPMSDRWARWITCFGLARLSLAAALSLQFLGLASDLNAAGDMTQRWAATSITLLALFAAQQALSLIARAERQTRPGGLNTRRMTLRWQRLAWLAVAAWSVATGLAAGGTGCGVCGASVAWLGSIYFVSCTPAPPPARAWPRRVFA